MDIARYNPNSVSMDGHVTMFEFSEGEYVKFEDIKGLQLFLLQVQDVIQCNECSDIDKVAGIRSLVSEVIKCGIK